MVACLHSLRLFGVVSCIADCQLVHSSLGLGSCGHCFARNSVISHKCMCQFLYLESYSFVCFSRERLWRVLRKRAAVVIHLQIYLFTFSHLQIYILTPSHLQIYIFTPSHLQIYILTLSHLLIYIFTPSHLQIYIFTPSHLQIYFLAPSHLQIFSLSSFLSLALLSISLLRWGRCRQSATKRDRRSIPCTSDVQT